MICSAVVAAPALETLKARIEEMGNDTALADLEDEDEGVQAKNEPSRVSVPSSLL